jgi:hypothetical protein
MSAMTLNDFEAELVKRDYFLIRKNPLVMAKRDGIRIEWRDIPGWNSALVYVRSKTGGFNTRHSNHTIYFYYTDVIRALNEIDKMVIPGKKIHEKPQPMKFLNLMYAVNNNGHIEIKNQICSVKISVVCLEENGHISSDIVDPNKPVWYMCDCIGTLGATFNIITDGDVYYAVNRYPMKNMRTTITTKPKASVDLTKLSKGDHDLILYAIEQYRNKL